MCANLRFFSELVGFASALFCSCARFSSFRGATSREMSAHREERRSRTSHGEIVPQKHDYRGATSYPKRLPVVRRSPPASPLYLFSTSPFSKLHAQLKKTTSELEKTTSEPRKTTSEVDLPPPYSPCFGPFSRFFLSLRGNGYSRARMRTLLYILFMLNVAGLLQGA